MFQKSNHLAMRIKEAAVSVRDKLTASATAVQAIGRGYLGRKRVKVLRQLVFQRTVFLAVKLQAIYRDWKSRIRVNVLRKLRTTSKAAQRLFQVCRGWTDLSHPQSVVCDRLVYGWLSFWHACCANVDCQRMLLLSKYPFIVGVFVAYYSRCLDNQ